MSDDQTSIEVISARTCILDSGSKVVGPDGVSRNIAENEDDTYVVHGVAIGSGDVTRGSSGIKKYWPGEELEAAAKSLQGQPLVQDHDNSSKGVVGRIVKAGYKEDVGVIYEAELYDEELATNIKRGLLEVSIRGYHISVDDMDEREDGSKVVQNIAFDNLSIVPTGAAPSNSIQMGEHAELSVSELSEYINTMEELQEWQPGDYVQWGDNHGIILELTEDGAAIVDNYHKTDDGKWQSSMDEEEVSSGDLSEWDVDEENIVASDDDGGDEEPSEDEDSDEDDDEEEAEADVSEGDFVQWHSGEGRVVELGTDEARVQPYAKNEQVWEPTNKETDVMIDDLETWDVDEDNVSDKGSDELSASIHNPSYDGTRESDSWDSLSLSDFTSDSWEDLSNDEQSDIAGHFLASMSGFPPDSFGDLKLPVVHPSGDLDLAGLNAANSRASQTDGVDTDEVQSKIQNLAEDNFDVDWSEESYDASGSEEADDDGPTVTVLTGNDLLYGESNKVRGRHVPIRVTSDNTMFNEEELEDLDNPVAVEQADIEELRQKASDYEDLQEEQKTVEEMSNTLDELRERTEVLDEVDRDLVDELNECDDPIVMEESRFSELESETETVKQLYADRLAEQTDFFTPEELMEKNSIEELREKFEQTEGELEEELEPEPKGQDPSEEELEEQAEEEEEQEEEELSAEVSSKQEELREKMLN